MIRHTCLKILKNTARHWRESKLTIPNILRVMDDKTNSTSVKCLSTSTRASKLDLTGIYPPIATPFNNDESIAYEKLQYNLEKWNNVPLRGYVVQGSNGEYAFLDHEERVEMIKRVSNMIPKDKLILAGAGCESTRQTIDMSERMAQAGAHAVLVVTPCYYKGRMTDSALKEHYKKIADSSPVPVILYSVPMNTGIDLSPSVIVQLASHPNIIGVKDSGGDITKIANIVHQTQGEDFQVLAGSASFLYPALSMGAVGGVCALANILAAECCELQATVTAGNHAEAQRLQQRLIGPNTGVTKQFGVSGLKAAMDWFGYYGGPVRAPLEPLTDTEAQTLKQIFSNNNFI